MLTMEAPTKPASPVERAIAALLVENTGSHFLDSGGVYGRAWQFTRAKYGLDGGLPNSKWHGGPGHTPVEPADDDIERVALAMREEPEGTIDEFGMISVDTFHFLVQRLDYDATFDRKFRRFVDKLWQASRDEQGYTALSPRIEWPYETGAIERFMDQLRVHGAFVSEDASVNTYNGEDSLDRTLQYTVFTVTNSEQRDPADDGTPLRYKAVGPRSFRSDEGRVKPEFLPDGTYVALQIHGGADVRGGYTDAHLFTLVEPTDLMDNDRFEVWCDGAMLVPDAQVPGQITMEAEVLEPEEVRHFWDNSYGDGKARRYDREIGDQVEEFLILPYNDRDREEVKDGLIEDGYGERKRMVKANVATFDTEAKVWRCPFDNSPLHASGAVVG